MKYLIIVIGVVVMILGCLFGISASRYDQAVSKPLLMAGAVITGLALFIPRNKELDAIAKIAAFGIIVLIALASES